MGTSVLMAVATVLLVLGACALYLTENYGWAQLCLVFASGTAGTAVYLLFVSHRDQP